MPPTAHDWTNWSEREVAQLEGLPIGNTTLDPGLAGATWDEWAEMQAAELGGEG